MLNQKNYDDYDELGDDEIYELECEQVKLRYFKERLLIAEQGDVDSQLIVAHLYYQKLGYDHRICAFDVDDLRIVHLYDFDTTDVESEREAFKWYLRAAIQGNDTAQYIVATMYYFGICIEKNVCKSISWYTKAAKRGNSDAAFALGILFFFGYQDENGKVRILKDFAVAKQWCGEAARAGNTDAAYFLGNMYFYGDGINRNFDKAFECYQQAVNCDHKDAMFYVSRSQAFGEGTEQNYEKALKSFDEWLKKAI